MKDWETPLRLVRLWGKIAPDVWKQLDRCSRSQRVYSDGSRMCFFRIVPYHFEKTPRSRCAAPGSGAF